MAAEADTKNQCMSDGSLQPGEILPRSVPPYLVVAPTKSFLASKLADDIAEFSERAIRVRGTFSIALSGGSLPAMLSGLANNTNIEWDKWVVFFADERFVPLDSPDSNFQACKTALFSKVHIPPSQICAINPDLSLENCALDYERRLMALVGDDFGCPRIDVVLLGMGPDGHTASLFPGHELLKHKVTRNGSGWVAPIADSPKPPPQRITLTLPTLNAARTVGFVATGTSKACKLREILTVQQGELAIKGEPKDREDTPAAMVRPRQLMWYVDEQAVSEVDSSAIALQYGLTNPPPYSASTPTRNKPHRGYSRDSTTSDRDRLNSR
eukprot:498362_1